MKQFTDKEVQELIDKIVNRVETEYRPITFRNYQTATIYAALQELNLLKET